MIRHRLAVYTISLCYPIILLGRIFRAVVLQFVSYLPQTARHSLRGIRHANSIAAAAVRNERIRQQNR